MVQAARTIAHSSPWQLEEVMRRFSTGLYFFFSSFFLWTIRSAGCLGVLFAAAVMLWWETITLVLWISLAVAKCSVNTSGKKKKKSFYYSFSWALRGFFSPHTNMWMKDRTQGGLKTIREESAPLLLKQLDTLCQAEPAKAEIPGSTYRTHGTHITCFSHSPLSYTLDSLHPFQKSKRDVLLTVSTWWSWKHRCPLTAHWISSKK